MNMNEVAKVLGVAFNEEFDIVGFPLNPCKVTENGLMDSLGVESMLMARMLLSGKREVKIVKHLGSLRNVNVSMIKTL